jgi:glucarate dehydratase
MLWNRRHWMLAGAAGAAAGRIVGRAESAESASGPAPLTITELRITPIALPDPPLLAASGCHGPYYLRNVVEAVTDGGIVGLGETTGGARVTETLEQAKQQVIGQNAFAYRRFAGAMSEAAYAAIEVACLDACGKATGRRLCELLGGPVREEVEFAAYLFYRYAADHPELLKDPRVCDDRGAGRRALDAYGEVRTPEAMGRLAEQFRDQYGFRVFKLKGGVLPPDVELDSMRALRERLGSKALLRIDPNARWTPETAVRIGKQLADVSLEYYEDPVAGQEAMAEVRTLTGLPTSTNMCVTRYQHIPDALRLHPVDVVLCDHHYWGGMTGCLSLGPISEPAGWKLSQHSNSHAGITMAAMIHLAASLPQLTYASDTHYPWLVDKAEIIAGGKLPIRGGKMPLPKSPGLGVELDRDQLARAHEIYRRSGMKQRDDAGTMQRIEPGWKRELF